MQQKIAHDIENNRLYLYKHRIHDKSEREINKSRLNSLLTTRLQCGLIATVKSVFSEIPRACGPCVSGSRAYADVSVGGKRGRVSSDPTRDQDVLPERAEASRVAEPAAEAAVQAVHGAAGGGLRGALHGPELALGPPVQLQGAVSGVALLAALRGPLVQHGRLPLLLRLGVHRQREMLLAMLLRSDLQWRAPFQREENAQHACLSSHLLSRELWVSTHFLITISSYCFSGVYIYNSVTILQSIPNTG